MNPDFNSGRAYERRELILFLNEALKTDDNKQLRELLVSYMKEAAESLATPKKVIVVEDTYIVV